ncbi:DUF6415 family natural product biosynthesis protein [Streptomyces sp. NEAU-S7GS2]|uniref:DUF6415 family natural product biosynthesis protein n=1 Tax=Streptomyces sp. NEAU-S7GS2 TaxID=2202000 RepID=UPI000D6FEE04|nr:DUF6415 family natural product biosynthesis protein [Streptomyces sp. NEAU-S7GS2]AWN24812.1 hypothetical protein DKG71_00230 [Streptomyces sp. NEAU-S7GS2]
MTATAVGYDVQRLREIIEAAKQKFDGTALPPHRDIDQFVPLLERCIRTMLPYAHVRADQLAAESRAGKDCQRAIERVGHLRAGGPGSGLVSATAYASNLAHCLGELLELAERALELK